jgi:hypothetical protein
MSKATLDQTIARLQNLAPFNIYQVTQKGNAAPWYNVTGGIVKDLVLYEDKLAEQVQTISAQIMHWGRLAAQAKRVWEITERQYRIWRDRTTLTLLDPMTKPDGWKKPTKDQCDATIRTQPEYVQHYTNQERAEEAYNAAMAVLDGFRAKRDMIKEAVMRATEGSAARLAV